MWSDLLEELSQDPDFTDRCQHWAWAKYNPGETVPETEWPPGKSGQECMVEYYWLLMRKTKAHIGENWVEPANYAARVALAKSLSLADPYVRCEYTPTPWVTVNIRGTDTRIPVTAIASWVKFAANVYTVTLNDARVGRVTDSAFEQKVA